MRREGVALTRIDCATTRVQGVAVPMPLVTIPSPVRPPIPEESPHMTNAESTDEATGAVDPGMVRAGAAAAARRRELDISQRSLAADGIINAGALIAFEKGRSWPRERTRAKLEEVLRWPPGTIARLRDGQTPVPDEETAQTTAAAATTSDEIPLVAQAVVTAVHTLASAADALPPIDDPQFTPRVSAILADLRQLEAVAARAAR